MVTQLPDRRDLDLPALRETDILVRPVDHPQATMGERDVTTIWTT
jgi:hypothetical protein